jgi:pimeloyl-ACP methyl ester carboxylesterase
MKSSIAWMTWFIPALWLGGCAARPDNPSFQVSFKEAEQAVDQMRAQPKGLRRPLVLVGGILDPNVSPPLYQLWFGKVTRDANVIRVSVGFCGSFEACRAAMIEEIEKKFPSGDPNWTVEVDVMGASLGGLVARYAAAPSRDPASPKRVRIARLFTISSPHQGANLAETIALIQLHRDLRPGSDFLKFVAAQDASATYKLYPYVRLDDEIVGAEHAAPQGVNPLWLPNTRGTPAHTAAMMDPRILADIARRLRDEPPLSHEPRSPLPPGR